MNTLRIGALCALLGIVGAASAADGCAAGGGLEFVCGPQNAEDLVLVPGTKWIVSSGMAPGAAFYLIDSRDGAWSAVQPQAKHDPAFANCTTPPDLAKSNTHGLSLRAAGGSRSTLYAVGHGPQIGRAHV